jgi:AraC family transcriptional regulator, positive regulator of tynA and feaB
MGKLIGTLSGLVDLGCDAEPLATAGPMIESAPSIDTSQLDFEAWRAFLRSNCGDQPEVVDPNAFASWVRRFSVYGLPAAAIRIQCGFATAPDGRNRYRSERTHRDVRIAGADHYYAVFQVAGRSVLTQSDHAVQLAAGDVALFDAARPAACVSDNAQWLGLHLPRQSLLSHLACEPQGGLCARGGTPAVRLLFDLVRGADQDGGSPFSPADSYMQLVVYDLLGALFAPCDPPTVSRHVDKLFARIRGVIRDGFADPDFGPREVAAVTGISLRYLQKLFTARGLTCSEFIYSLRLDHAARLLHRRWSLRTSQPLSEIAYTCGFRDYTHFARKFRRRYGHTPGAHSGGDSRAGN